MTTCQLHHTLGHDQGDPRTVLQVVSKIVDLLSIQFDISDLRAKDNNSTAELLKQLEALK